jgi:pimeloyl-ACP methyl ester carboxylesterase
MVQLQSIVLSDGVRVRYVNNHNGLTVHVLEAGFDSPGRPVVLLLHGFPELAYSWRKLMPLLAAAGYHVIAPDQRGYGRTTGWDDTPDGDVPSFRTHNMARDALGLVMAMGHRSVDAVIGHDFGAMVAAYCALVRPDVFRRLVLMSLPFEGPPALPFDAAREAPASYLAAAKIHEQLAALPRPRKDNLRYFATREANDDILQCEQGLHDFLRAYYHMKSADWKQNDPYRLASFTADELAKLPTYYIMDLDATMPATVAPEMPSAAEVAACRWLPDAELRVYSTEFQRTGFHGAAKWIRCQTGMIGKTELELFSGRAITVPSCFISGRADWGIYRKPGAVERMQGSACTRMERFHLVEDAGHWVQQEKPERVSELVLEFLRHAGAAQ